MKKGTVAHVDTRVIAFWVGFKEYQVAHPQGILPNIVAFVEHLVRCTRQRQAKGISEDADNEP